MENIVISDGRIKCLITGKMRKETPEEIVRQEFCRMLLDVYNYPKDCIEIEFPIKIGRTTKRADIVVFHSNQKTQSNAYIVVENKKDKELDGIEQVYSYISASTSEFGVWTNGTAIKYFQKHTTQANKITEIPDIPKYKESIDAVGKYKKSDLVPSTDLKGIFEKCNNYFYVNQGLTQDKRFTEILKLLFIKIEDEKHYLKEECNFYITPQEKITDKGLQNCRERIEQLYGAVKSRYKKDNIFEDEDTIKLNDRCLSFAVAELQKYSLLETNLDVKGIAFETFVGANLRGEHGEFFTPREVVEMAVKMINPQPDEMVLDPSCGSGGFLVYTLKHVREIYKKSLGKKFHLHLENINREYSERFIRGIDFNPDLARVSKMNMVLNDDGHTGLFHFDTLTPLEDWPKNMREKITPNQVDIILSNPPFGDKCKIDDKRILMNFDLGHKWVFEDENNKWVKTNEVVNSSIPDVLFIERCLELLKPGGRMAMVLPDGILGNSKLGYVRQYILEKAYILGIVDCPVETFLPSVDTKTSVLFLKKKKDTALSQTFDVFMAIGKTCGHDRRGKIIYKRDYDGNVIYENGEPVIDNDLIDIAKEFDEYAKNKNLFN
ncbi:N-6 DNA methylase [Bacillus inaquosorum]|uniref:N-6 DNA methylase n=1 Tax=Bacillus inaquosorum TaxID=483913 RepID=UPI0022810F8D|nr:N-6 DNA methylase [Bacillus inaquosorum]MCY7751466.1 N-6 DNA methylase [Bacillus inaquosorum]